jgi:TonB-dependent starch-binding outer membrane protein SusC
MMKRLLFFCLCLIGISTSAFSQNGTITGKVTDLNGPIPGASVTLANSPLGASTNTNGEYKIENVPSGKTLTIIASAVGYRQTEEIVLLKAGGTIALNFILSEDTKSLDEVVVTGLAINTKQKELGTSRAGIGSAVIESLPAPTVENALVGRLAGVEAYSTDGSPGGGFRFRIRGANSISGSSEPLLIVDGIFMDNANRNAVTGAAAGANGTGSATFGMQNGTRGLAALNPDDIESIEILKGAAAASLYGSRAASGVIVVKTKKGKGKLSLDYTLDTGISEVHRGVSPYKMDWTGTEIEQWAAFVNPTKSIYRDADIAAYKNTQLKDYTLDGFRQGTFNRSTLRVQGGNKYLGYYVSGNTQKTIGHTKGTDFDTKGVLVGLNSEAIRGLSVRVNLNYQDAFRSQIASGTPGFFVPNRWAVDATAMPFMSYNTTTGQTGDVKNNVTGLRNLDDYTLLRKESASKRITASGNINYKILSNLAIDINAGIDKSDIDGEILYPVGLVSLFPTGRYDFDREELTQKTLTIGMNHSWKINDKMYLKSAVGTQYDENERFYDYQRWQTLTAGKDARDTTSYTAPQRPQFFQVLPIVKTLGIYFNETFGWNDKLFLNLGGRLDRSTSFVEQFFFYPRASVSYQLKQNIRLRAAYGQSGTQPTAYLSTLTWRSVAGGYNGSGSSYVPNNPPNEGLTPETQSEFEIGADATFLNERVKVELTYYNKQFKDLLLNSIINPALNYGLVTGIRNVGSMYNRGLEFQVGADIIAKKDFNWNINFTGFTQKNEVTEMPAPKTPLPGGIDNVVQIREGYPISGIWAGTASELNNVNTVTLAPENAGRKFLGSTLPSFEGNVNTSITYKGLSLIALIGGKSGLYKYNQTARDLANPTKRMHVDYWNVATADLTILYNDQSKWVQKADFLKLRQLNISYAVPRATLEKTVKYVKKLNISLVGSNLITWSKYQGGYDIESETGGSGAANAAWAWTRGIDSWDGGVPRTYTLSFNIGF